MAKQLLSTFRHGAAILALALAAFAPGLARADDQAKMQGSWNVNHAQVGGMVANKAQMKEMAVTIEETKLTLKEGPKTYVVHFTLIPEAKPTAVEFFKDDGKKEKIWHGIYEFDGKELKLCWGPAGEPRPKTFGGGKKGKDDRYFKVYK